MTKHPISDYINNLPIKTSFCKGYKPSDVYEVISNISSMYNQALSEAYDETEELKHRLEILEKEYKASL